MVIASRQACTAGLLCDYSKLIQMKVEVKISFLLPLNLPLILHQILHLILPRIFPRIFLQFLPLILLRILLRIPPQIPPQILHRILLLRYSFLTKHFNLFPPIFLMQQAPLAVLIFSFLWLQLQLTPKPPLLQLLLPLQLLLLSFFLLHWYIRALYVYYLRAVQSDSAPSHCLHLFSSFETYLLRLLYVCLSRLSYHCRTIHEVHSRKTKVVNSEYSCEFREVQNGPSRFRSWLLLRHDVLGFCHSRLFYVHHSYLVHDSSIQMAT